MAECVNSSSLVQRVGFDVVVINGAIQGQSYRVVGNARLQGHRFW
jgi:hypothetical protein